MQIKLPTIFFIDCVFIDPFIRSFIICHLYPVITQNKSVIIKEEFTKMKRGYLFHLHTITNLTLIIHHAITKIENKIYKLRMKVILVSNTSNGNIFL